MLLIFVFRKDVRMPPPLRCEETRELMSSQVNCLVLLLIVLFLLPYGFRFCAPIISMLFIVVVGNLGHVV